MEKKKIIGGIQEKRCRMIGIAGSNVGVGCTHFSIMLANYLADYYKHAGPENIKEVLLEGYDDILIDFGSVKDGEHESYWRCDKKFLVGSLTEWQQESFREFEMEQRAKQKKSWQSLAVFGSEETRREFSRRYRINAERIPFSADAFSVTEECGEFFKRIL